MVLLSLEFSGNWEKQKDKIMSSSYQFMFSSYHLIALCSCLFDHLLLPKVPFSSMQFFLSDHGPVCSPSSPWSQISTSVLPSSHQSWSPINIFLWETSWTSDSEKEQTKGKLSVFWIWWWFLKRDQIPFLYRRPHLLWLPSHLFYRAPGHNWVHSAYHSWNVEVSMVTMSKGS